MGWVRLGYTLEKAFILFMSALEVMRMRAGRETVLPAAAKVHPAASLSAKMQAVSIAIHNICYQTKWQFW